MIIKPMLESSSASTIDTYTAASCPDTVSFLSKSESNPILCSGTYTLHEDGSTQTHTGQLITFTISQSLQLVSTGSLNLDYGIFDLVYPPCSNFHIFYTANTNGTISCFNLNSETNLLSLQSNTTVAHDSMITSIIPTDQNVYSTSSSGKVFQTDSATQITTVQGQHSFDAWCCHYHSGSKTLLSGGDDALIRRWDPRVPSQVGCFKHHSAGVISLYVEEEGKEHEVLSGGYDDYIHKWDLRFPRRVLIEKKLSGGVWDIVEVDSKYFLCSCMYGGVSLIDKSSFEVISEYKGHDSIVYGADYWSRGTEVYYVSCSFYDNGIHMWKASNENGI
ncbi:hypothetical protein P9112_008075 [Eukaryota sp. TZLM1-RC]